MTHKINHASWYVENKYYSLASGLLNDFELRSCVCISSNRRICTIREVRRLLDDIPNTPRVTQSVLLIRCSPVVIGAVAKLDHLYKHRIIKVKTTKSKSSFQLALVGNWRALKFKTALFFVTKLYFEFFLYHFSFYDYTFVFLSTVLLNFFSILLLYLCSINYAIILQYTVLYNTIQKSIHNWVTERLAVGLKI